MDKILPENTLIFTDYCKSFKLIYKENPNKHKIYLHNEWCRAEKLRKTININNIEDTNIKYIIIDTFDTKLENYNLPYWIEHVFIYSSCSFNDKVFDSSNIKLPFGCQLHIETENTDYSYWSLDENYEYNVYTLYKIIKIDLKI